MIDGEVFRISNHGKQRVVGIDPEYGGNGKIYDKPPSEVRCRPGLNVFNLLFVAFVSIFSAN